jgi:tetratricopeptide (TPR) repeat protein
MNLFAGAARDRAVYMETEAPIRLGGWSELAALRTDDRKYVEAPDPELDDLRADPAEAANLWSAGEGGAWRARVDNVRAPARIVASESLDADDRARLEALGYVQADVADEETDRPDPKSGLDAYLAALESESLYSQGRYSEAAELAHRAVTSNPDLVQAVRVLAFCHLRLGRHEEAIELLDRTTQRRPDPYLLRSFAQALIVDGRMDDARRVLDRYEAIAPGDGRVPLLRGDILVTEGKPEAAEERYREAKRRDPRRVGKVAEQRIQRLPSHGGH